MLPQASVLNALVSACAWPVGPTQWDDNGVAAEGYAWLMPTVGPLPCLVTLCGSGSDTSAITALVRRLSVSRESLETAGEKVSLNIHNDQVLVCHAYVRVEETTSSIVALETSWTPLPDYNAMRLAHIAIEWFDPNLINPGAIQ